MVESSNEPNLIRRAYASCNPFRKGAGDQPVLPLTNDTVLRDPTKQLKPTSIFPSDDVNDPTHAKNGSKRNVAEKPSQRHPPPAPPSNDTGSSGETSTAIVPDQKPNAIIRFYRTFKDILLSTWLNILLIFVPIGVAVQIAGITPTVVFAVNAIAIVPLAGLLTHATESVASDLGDTIGALMNVTFGNAVELIIFIALAKNEIRIVQASLLGSILANLLLILGMCLLFGGLRFREQIYNSTVTQMSACLLSLSVMSLLLPTAFHASFTDTATADKAVIRVSRGTSLILLLVYVLYLLFQLKSHAYMYQSTPQHVIDEESHPGVLAEMLGSSSSSGTSSSSGSSESDTDRSSHSNTTAKRIKRVLRGRRRRKSSASSKDTQSMPSTTRTPSVSTFNHAPDHADFAPKESRIDRTFSAPQLLGILSSGDEADTEAEHEGKVVTLRDPTVNFRDFENEKGPSDSKSPEAKPKRRKSKRTRHKPATPHKIREESIEKAEHSHASEKNPVEASSATPHVEFAKNIEATTESSSKRPFNLRGISVLGTIPAMPMPTIPRMLSSTVFSATNPTGLPTSGPSSLAGPSRSLRRTKSLTDINERGTFPPSQSQIQPIPVSASHPSLDSEDSSETKKHMSRTSAILLLLISTGLVAVCAEFLVDSINYLVDNTSVSEAFVGLIILPIVGNAAEHVTAVTVASKNKMDLAIGVAVGSSIQIALFVTPVIVLLGWMLAKDMSLYFTIFETVSLFVSAFIVNFLVLDGRSNYLEGALLIAAYVIIALAAGFYPDSTQQSTLGGAENAVRMIKML